MKKKIITGMIILALLVGISLRIVYVNSILPKYEVKEGGLNKKIEMYGVEVSVYKCSYKILGEEAEEVNDFIKIYNTDEYFSKDDMAVSVYVTLTNTTDEPLDVYLSEFTLVYDASFSFPNFAFAKYSTYNGGTARYLEPGQTINTVICYVLDKERYENVDKFEDEMDVNLDWLLYPNKIRINLEKMNMESGE